MKRCTRLLIFFLQFIVVCHIQSFGQVSPNKTFLLKGEVVDATTKLPLSDVLVTCSFLRNIVRTDSLGKFSIEVIEREFLSLSKPNYHVYRQYIGSRDTILVHLEKDTVIMIDEVYIQGGYYVVKDKYRTGSIGRVTAEEIGRQPVSNPLLALQGRVPGLTVLQQSGVPGNAVKIQIRGQNSLRANANNPLYVIDGVPFNNEPQFASVAGSLLPFGMDPLNTLNMENIESIEILKDADATAIYGSRGANGVVLITTKRAQPFATRVDIKLGTGFSQAQEIPLLQTADYLRMRREAFENDGIIPSSDPNSGVSYAPDLLLWDTLRNTNWQETLLGRNAPFRDLQLSLSGGNENTFYRISTGWKREEMVFSKDLYHEVQNLGLLVQHKGFNNKLLVQLNGNFGLANNQSTTNNLFSTALTLPPNAPSLYQPDGTLNWENGTWSNPIAPLRIKNSNVSKDINLNILVNYQFGYGLSAKVSFGVTDNNARLSTKTPISSFNPEYTRLYDLKGTSLMGQNQRFGWISEPQLFWNKEFGRHQVDVLIGSSFQSNQSKMFMVNSSGFLNDALLGNMLAANSNNIYQDQKIDYRFTSLFTRAGYVFDQKYFVNLTGRRDGSSRFGPDRRFGTFGAIGAAWIISNEPFFSTFNKKVNFLKLRGSFGTTGNDQIGDYGYFDAYTISNYGGVVLLKPSQLFNPSFSWEVNRKTDIELDIRLLKERLTSNITWFRNRSSNQLVGYGLPLTTGFSSIQSNLPATVENKGWEFTLGYRSSLNAQFQWSSQLNYTIPKNTLIEYPQIETSTYANTYVVGKSLQVRKLYQYEGLDPEGYYAFKDINGDNRLNIEDRIQIKELGRLAYGGFNQTFSYRKISLQFLAEYVAQTLMAGPIGYSLPGRMANQPAYVFKDSNIHLQHFTSLTTRNSQFTSIAQNSDLNYARANFVRLKSFSISYQLPQKIVKDINLTNLEMYAQAQNLFTISKSNAINVETGSYSYLPPLRVFMFGIRSSI